MSILIYGGTFDPIHYGHLRTALQVQQDFHFDRVLFLPCKTPVLKKTAMASAKQRIEMIELAFNELHCGDKFAIDLTEINRQTPSYMANTLSEFRTRYGATMPITLLMGQDAFYELPQWHDWKLIIELANLLIIKRSGFEQVTPPPLIAAFLQKHQTTFPQELTQKAQGAICLHDAGGFPFSSSLIRQCIIKEKNLDNYLPKSVIEYIKKNRLYS